MKLKIMKKILYIAIAALFLLQLTGCNKTNNDDNLSNITENPYAYIGKLHNDFMTNVKNNFNPNPEITTLEDGIDFIKDFHVAHVLQSDLTPEEKEMYIAFFNEYKRFVNTPEFYNEFFASNSKNSEDCEYFNIMKEAYSFGIIDDFEIDRLNLIGQLLIENYEGVTSDSELERIILQIQDEWSAKRYAVNSDKGQILAMTLAISISSIEWWKENPDAIELTRALPAVVGVDISNGIVGAVVGAINCYINTGGVTWGSVACGAAIGAISGSTGAAGKLWKWLTGLF